MGSCAGFIWRRASLFIIFICYIFIIILPIDAINCLYKLLTQKNRKGFMLGNCGIFHFIKRYPFSCPAYCQYATLMAVDVVAGAFRLL